MSVAELRAVEALQRTVWGVGDLDVVPSHQLVAAREAGGPLIGAFDGPTLVGFAYGFPGLTREGPSIHSHLVAVHPEYRSHQIGARLKRAQRDHALARGILRMTWTFDPLRTINAHFNFCKLGVVSDRYIVDFYPEEQNNVLNRAGTDRLWVTWALDAERVAERLGGRVPSPPDLREDGAEILVQVGPGGEPVVERSLSANGPVVIEVPPAALDEEHDGAGNRWREATREAFRTALARGYVVQEFYRPGATRPHGLYLLTRNGSSA